MHLSMEAEKDSNLKLITATAKYRKDAGPVGCVGRGVRAISYLWVWESSDIVTIL